MPLPEARVSQKGADRWRMGHPWIYRSDLLGEPDAAGLCRVLDRKGKYLGTALYSPRSEIRLRLLSTEAAPLDAAWWRERLESAVARREGIDASACRLVHGEGDGLPSLVVDRYDRWLVVQLLSAGLETMRETILDTLMELCHPDGILLRHQARKLAS